MREMRVMMIESPKDTLPASCTYTGEDDADMIEVENGVVMHVLEETTGYASSDPCTVMYEYAHVVVAFIA